MSKHHHHHERCPEDRRDFIERLLDSCCFLHDDLRPFEDLSPFEDLLPSEDFRPTNVLPISDRFPQRSFRNSCGRSSCNVCPEEEAIFEKIIKHCCCCEDDKKCEPHFSKEKALEIAKVLGVNTDSPCFNLDQFWMGLNVELEHGLRYPSTNITNNDPILTGKIALAHLNQYPDYYTRLARMRREASEYWNRVRRSI